MGGGLWCLIKTNPLPPATTSPKHWLQVNEQRSTIICGTNTVRRGNTSSTCIRPAMHQEVPNTTGSIGQLTRTLQVTFPRLYVCLLQVGRIVHFLKGHSRAATSLADFSAISAAGVGWDPRTAAADLSTCLAAPGTLSRPQGCISPKANRFRPAL